MTGLELNAARLKLGLSAYRLARLLGVSGSWTVRRWELGLRKIPGSVPILMKWIEREKG